MATLAAVDLVDAGDRNATARQNMEAFSVADAQDADMPVSALADFLCAAHRAYSLAATRARLSGWFYAWHDVLAGQLCMSACWSASASALPFAGRITLVDDPAAVASDALSSEFARGIPWSQFAEEARPGPEPEPPPTLVYARALIGSS